MGRVTAFSKPGQPLLGEGGVTNPPQELGFGFSYGESFLSCPQLKKHIIQVRNGVPFYPSLLPLLSHSLPTREVFTHLWSQGQTCQAPVMGVLWEKGVPYLGGNNKMLHRVG